MKARCGIVLGTAILLVGTFYGITQPTQNSAQFQDRSDRAKQGPEAHSYRPVSLNPNTWEIISPDGNPASVAHLNTPELRRQREQAAFAVIHPEENNRRLAKTPERLAYEIQAAFAILNPDEASVMAEKWRTPEQREARRRAIDAIVPKQ